MICESSFFIPLSLPTTHYELSQQIKGMRSEKVQVSVLSGNSKFFIHEYSISTLSSLET